MPIRLKIPRHFGTQSEHGVLCTDFARQAAERLFDEDGRFDRSAVPRVIEDARTNPRLPEHHRRNLVNTLTRIAQNEELANILGSICAHPGVSLKGPAADMVRATLNLPSGEPLTPAHARRAATMALLGNLRQGQVGSCFATSTAICLHEDSPEAVAKDLKTLLETNKLSFHKNGAQFDLPLNKRISTGDLDIQMLVRADGTCYGKALGNAGHGASYKLHETPGMQAALTALGIAPSEMQQAVSTALREMGWAAKGTYGVSKRSIIEHIAHRHAKSALSGNTLANALNAYAGREDVRLLRAWEYTLAGAAEIDYQAAHVDRLSAAALFGRDIPGRPDLGSLGRHAGILSQALAADPNFRSTPLNEISTRLFSDIQGVLKDRFILQFDADVKHNTISSDGSSSRGGFTLHDRLPPDDPSRWVRIDNPKMFQLALTHAVREAAARTQVRMRGMPGDPQANQAALQAYVLHLSRHIQTDAFTEFTARGMNPELAGQPNIDLDQCKNLPWKETRGADARPVFRQYGGNHYRASIAFSGGPIFAQPNVMSSGSSQAASRPDDAAPVLDFLFGSVRSMGKQLETVVNKPDAKLPVTNALHAFSLYPASFKDALQYKGVTSQQWMTHHLVTPSQQHVKLQRFEPPLERLLDEMVRKLRMTPAQRNAFYHNIAIRTPKTAQGAHPYSLEQIHQELLSFCQSQEPSRRADMQTEGESVLTRFAPLPGKVIADTNWSDSAGNPRLMLAVHNPFQNRVELHVADFNGGNRMKLDDKWIAGQWFLSPPIGARPANGQ